MKLPALWIAAAFAAGIALASRWPGALRLWIAAAVLAILLAGISAWRNRLAAAGTLALLAWILTGAVAMNVERAAVPARHVTRLIAAGRIDTDDTLRWRGRLRDDPMSLPWGTRYTIDLEEVESAGAKLPAAGGLRLSLYGDSHSPADARNLRAGDRVEALVKARPPRNFLDPGAFDLRGYLAGQSIDLSGSLRSIELLQVIDRPKPTLSQRLARARGDLLARLDALFSAQPERAAVLRAMLLGDRSFVDSQVVTAFQKTAAYHVLVVAGLHVGAIVIFVFWVCRKLRFSMVVTSLVTLGILAAYVGVVEDRPPILRSALMAMLYLCARPLFRRVELLNTIALAALALLIWKPSSLTDPSFELSFLAAGVVAGLALPWMERSTALYRAGLRHLQDTTRDGAHPPKIAQFRIEMRAASHWFAAHLPQRFAPHAQTALCAPVRAGLRLWEIVLLSVAIQLGMMPLLAQDFHRVSLSGPLSNIPAVILTGLIVPLGFLTLALTFVWARLAMLFAKALGGCTGLLLAIVEWFSHLPHLSYRVPDPPVWLVILFFIALTFLAATAGAAAAQRRTRRARRQLPPPIAVTEGASAIALAALTILIAWHPFAPRFDHGKLEVTVLDVGQGDSIFAAFPDGRTMLVDVGGLAGSEWIGGSRSGTDIGEEVVSPYLWSRGLKKIDVVALTHADHDHIDGLHAVLDNFKIGELWIGRDEDRPAFNTLLEEARSRGIPIVRRTRGDGYSWGNIETDVLWPRAGGPPAKLANDNSLVLRLSDGQIHFLLTGDIEQHSEESLVADGAPLKADFLKVPHHGSKTSSTAAFLAAVSPRFAAVSVGEGNPFGHPAQATVERYAQDGVRLLRTDQDGAITAITDGRSLALDAYVQHISRFSR